MTIRKRAAPLPFGIDLEPNAALPLYRQVALGLQRVIEKGLWLPGAPLPSSRHLASELGVSRNTIISAFLELEAQGIVSPRARSVTRVAIQPQIVVSKVSSIPNPLPRNWAFAVGVPALDEFPRRLWASLLMRRARHVHALQMYYQNPFGFMPLRIQIAAYLRASRGLDCQPEQIMLTMGSQHALDLCTRVICKVGDQVWLENPGYIGAIRAFKAAHLNIVSVPVDEFGLNVNLGVEKAPRAKLAYVTPANQFPLGVCLSLTRRLELLTWASRAGAYIIEDDYDHEFRYAGHSPPALASLEPQGRVIYIGTMSKVMFPSLRIGYMVLPPNLLDAFANAMQASVQHTPILEQAALADFMEQGAFAKHLKAMRTLCAERQVGLLEAGVQEFPELTLQPAEAGMHLLAQLPAGVYDVTARQAALKLGVLLEPLSLFCLEPITKNALMLGYPAVPKANAILGMKNLHTALNPLFEN
jgi:GntR family transcriptional regulator / MocR family aminotransferase